MLPEKKEQHSSEGPLPHVAISASSVAALQNPWAEKKKKQKQKLIFVRNSRSNRMHCHPSLLGQFWKDDVLYTTLHVFAVVMGFKHVLLSTTWDWENNTGYQFYWSYIRNEQMEEEMQTATSVSLSKCTKQSIKAKYWKLLTKNCSE